jgi:hypothetical protein
MKLAKQVRLILFCELYDLFRLLDLETVQSFQSDMLSTFERNPNTIVLNPIQGGHIITAPSSV